MPSYQHLRPCCGILNGLLLALAAPAAAQAASDDALAFFETRIRPVLATHCYECHGPEKQKAGLRLDHITTMLKGGDNGPAVVPGDAAASRLIRAVSYMDVDLQMPPRGRLPEAAIADLGAWVAAGAAWPEEPLPGTRPETPEFDLATRRAAHWAWQPLHETPPPAVQDAAWPRGAVDRFVLARLEAAGLRPAPEADRGALLRRVTFDLTGLPPTAAEAQAFAADPRPDAYERAVDRLLASPRFGEHWARKWLDLTRFAETFGFEQDFPVPEAWRYRDYVIRAFNGDVPYDQLVREHIAGDLLPAPRRNPQLGYNESVIATGFWFMHQAQHAPVDVKQDHADRIDNQIDVFSKTFLGMTVACARCHDHKFDAISTQDYYALAGILRSSRRVLVEVDRPGSEAIAPALRAAQTRASELLQRSLAGLVRDRQRAAAEAVSDTVTPPASVEVFEDFDDGYDGWFVSGSAFGAAPTGARAWMLSQETPWLLPRGVAHSGTMSPKLRGALRSPTFTIAHDRIAFLAAGSKAKIRLIIENYMLRDIVPLLFESTLLDVDHGPAFRWLEMTDLGKYRGCAAYLELADEAEGYLGVDTILFGDEAMPAGSDASGDDPAVQRGLRAWLDGNATPDVLAAANERLRESGLESAEARGAFAELRESMAQAKTYDAARILAMADGTGRDTPVLIRGNPRSPGPEAPRRFLEAIAGAQQPPISEGSGRLALAERLLDPACPLPARVMVNRLWQHLFGRGIVASADNFGVMGTLPTHPELLEYLAAEFQRKGWSIRAMLRELVLSSTYRMQSAAQDAHAETQDPANVLLHRMPLKRLPAEAVRDSILAVAGTLDLAMYGPSVPAYISPFMGGQRKPDRSGPMDGARRRSIYLEVRRNFLPSILQAFDFPSPDTTHGTRNVSNVPAQALELLNNPFVAAQAEAWGARIAVRADETVEARIAELYWTAFARPPQPGESERAEAFLREQAARYPSDASRAWTELCHALFTLKEFIFIG